MKPIMTTATRHENVEALLGDWPADDVTPAEKYEPLPTLSEDEIRRFLAALRRVDRFTALSLISALEAEMASAS